VRHYCHGSEKGDLVNAKKAKGKRQKAKGKRQKAKGKRQKAKGKRQKHYTPLSSSHFHLLFSSPPFCHCEEVSDEAISVRAMH